MKKTTTILLLLTSVISFAQVNPVLEVFNDQVDAFNNADIERLVQNVTDDFKWFYITSDTLLLEVKGKEAFKKGMESYFSSGRNVLSEVTDYAIDGNRISFQEVVSHKNKAGESVSSSAMGIYEIRQRKIYRAWYFID
ncbi:MAG: nuclear transport factor 2 family protein [Cyclobacteriaceae bacterium]